jgi:vacuolar protein sorting-associated protein VTA1
LDSRLSTRVQKLAKGAASAVDFDDLETARLQLRQALDILEGRVTR